ncbi:response regulator [Fusibacter ferrireducens]|nr:response regulator [Fusibacter ferrireducens]
MLIDDEYYALQGIKFELDKMPECEIVGMFQDAYEAISKVESLNPDVILLDIEMPEITGIKCYEKLMEINEDLNVVFVTAYDHYAVKAFELNAVDYLLKPVKRNRLEKALSRVWMETKTTVEPSKIFFKCFNHFEIQYGNQVLNTKWRTKKAEELLAHLVCEKGHLISKDRLAEDLWPDLDGEKALTNLYVAHYYLRKQEKKNGIYFSIESQRGSMRILYDEIECDLKVFDRGVNVMKKSSKKMNEVEAALKVYSGQLLGDHYYSWLPEYQGIYEQEAEKMKKYLIRREHK